MEKTEARLAPLLFALDPGIRYGPQYQPLMPLRQGHLSVGLESDTDPVAVAKSVAQKLSLPI